MSRAGRRMDELELSVGTQGVVGPNPFPKPQEIEELLELGFTRLVLPFNPRQADLQRERLPDYVRYIRQFR